MKLTLARPEHAERISDFYRQVEGSNFPHPELLQSQTLARLLSDGELAIVVAIHGRHILGCGLAFSQSWNQSLEIGALTVGVVEDRGAVGKALFEALRRLGLKRYGVSFFRASSSSAFQSGRGMGASCWGYRPAPGSSRIADAELIMGFANPASADRRVEPPINAITRAPFASRLVQSLSGAEQGVPYPRGFPVGHPRGTGAPVISGRVWPSYHSRGNYIEIENAAGAHPVAIIKEFTDLVERKGVTDVRLTLPVNQEEAFFELIGFGFRPVAYLPGWYLRGAHRFDCVQLVRGVPPIPQRPQDFIERAVARIDSELNVG